VAKPNSPIVANITEAQEALDISVRALGVIIARAPEDITGDVRDLRAAILIAVKKLELAKLLVQDKEKRENG
jgi:hypothetical protein